LVDVCGLIFLSLDPILFGKFQSKYALDAVITWHKQFEPCFDYKIK